MKILVYSHDWAPTIGEAVGDAGLKYEPSIVRALAHCKQMAMEDATLRLRLGVAARERAVRLFTDERMITEHLRLYRRMLSVQDNAPAPRVPSAHPQHRAR